MCNVPRLRGLCIECSMRASQQMFAYMVCWTYTCLQHFSFTAKTHHQVSTSLYPWGHPPHVQPVQ